MSFSYYFQCLIRIWKKIEILKIQDGGCLWRYLYGCGCYVNQLDTTWFRLFENTKRAHYMCQISNQSDEWCQKWRGGVRLIRSPLILAPFFHRSSLPSGGLKAHAGKKWVQHYLHAHALAQPTIFQYVHFRLDFTLPGFAYPACNF